MTSETGVSRDLRFSGQPKVLFEFLHIRLYFGILLNKYSKAVQLERVFLGIYNV